jgi:energy-coupling factor transporter ATP-binding protein EcfA2
MFPPELLKSTPREQLAYFKGVSVTHPLLEQARRSLLDAINEPADASLIVLYGPTGVGKTTLLQHVLSRLIADAADEMEQDKSYIPVASVEAVAPSSGIFSWRDHYMRSLEALNEPMVNRKLALGPGLPQRDPAAHHNRKNATELDLRYALEKCLRYRRVRAFFIDEAQHLFKRPGGRSCLDQMDTIKSLANMTTTTHVLVGTYELMDMLSLSSQLCRRSIRVHFPRYARDDPQGHKSFARVLLTFQQSLPLRHEPHLLEMYDYMYDCSLGCVGLLKSWLVRSLHAALDDGRSRMTKAHLEATRLPTTELTQMARDILRAEISLAEGEHQHAELRTTLGATSHFRSTKPRGGSGPSGGARRRRVGKRKPGRDPVGAGKSG